MFDINFYMKFDELLSNLDSDKNYSCEEMFNKLEKIRSKMPYVYNIETTNRCNMKCKMCPRTTMMTRPIEDLDKNTFINIVSQIRPHSNQDWMKWKEFCENKYGIFEDEISENHFFLYVIPKVIQLHGYGDPLLDVNMDTYVDILSKNGFQSYFSCNPANINFNRTYKMMENGLNYIKYSIESVDDEEHKKIRGEASNFSESYKNILKILDYKKKNNLSTTIVITMLDLNRKKQTQDYFDLSQAFKDKDVYIYLKSENGQWYRKDFHKTKSIHWSEICKHPWMSTTVKSNGVVAMCPEDFNNEIILGNAKKDSLYDIWNGEAYKKFRLQHLSHTPGIKCTEECDMKLMYENYNIFK